MNTNTPEKPDDFFKKMDDFGNRLLKFGFKLWGYTIAAFFLCFIAIIIYVIIHASLTA